MYTILFGRVNYFELPLMFCVVFVAQNDDTKCTRVTQNNLRIFFFFRKVTLIFVALVNPRKRRVRNRVVKVLSHWSYTAATPFSRLSLVT